MHDIKAIRENPEAFDAAMKRRKLGEQSPAILKLDEERRAAQTQLQVLQARRNAESQKIGEIKKSGGDASAVMAQVAALKEEMAALEERERTLADSLSQHLAGLPNILSAETPDGADENDNVELRKWGNPRADKTPEHFEIGEALGMMDAETAAKMSGSRFTILSGPLARLERALAQLFLDTHTGEHGYTEVSPPLLVRDNALFGTGQLPKFKEDLFLATRFLGESEISKEAQVFKNLVLENSSKSIDTRDDGLQLLVTLADHGLKTMMDRLFTQRHWLIPTSEVPLTNIVQDSIVEPATLPRRYTAFTPCFRSEAGAAGKDTRGMIRQHQFYKVEMVSITKPEDSAAEHERMTRCAETVLEKLGLAYRTIILCSGDTGFGSTKTYDIEVWLPGQQRYREISSCSNCGEFQARRMNARYRAGEKDIRFLHTLNGSGVAVGRALIAVMENYYDPADGGIFVPDALKPYMGGLTKIAKAA